MTQEEKNILIKELCMRIPYGVKCNINGELCKVIRIDVECQQVYLKKDDEHGGTYSIVRGDIIKPYLRPMSSMTETERSELSRLTDDKFKFYLYTRKPEIICYEKYNYLEGLKVLDWLNKKMFDYRGLIPMGLVLEASEGMYNTKTE